MPSDPWSLSSSHPTSAPAMQALHSGHSEEVGSTKPRTYADDTVEDRVRYKLMELHNVYM